jgi:hypothetical protein
LYADEDEILIDVQRPVILNGIEDLATRSDLLDGAVVLELPPINEESRREERTLWAAFHESRAVPATLGGPSVRLASTSPVRRLGRQSTAVRSRNGRKGCDVGGERLEPADY